MVILVDSKLNKITSPFIKESGCPEKQNESTDLRTTLLVGLVEGEGHRYNYLSPRSRTTTNSGKCGSTGDRDCLD